MTFDCRKCHEKCKAVCCQSFPLPKRVYEENKAKIVRESITHLEFSEDDGSEYVTINTESGYCIFLNQDLTCNIYENRPIVCKTYGLGLPYKGMTQEDSECEYQAPDGRIRGRQERRNLERRKAKSYKAWIKKTEASLKDTNFAEMLAEAKEKALKENQNNERVNS